MILKINLMNQYSLISISLITSNLVLLFNNVECSNKRECDHVCIKSCPHNKEDVCGSNGLIYPNPCILKCCWEAEVDTSVCSENGMRRAKTGTETPTDNSNKKSGKHDRGGTKKNSHHVVPCEIDCYNSCSDDDAPVCGDDGKLFENSCKMDCCGVDEAKMKFCKDNGSKRAKIVKVQNIEQWKKSNPENDKNSNENDKHTTTSKSKTVEHSTSSPKEHDITTKDSTSIANDENVETTSTTERNNNDDEDMGESKGVNKKKRMFVGGTNQNDENRHEDIDSKNPENNDKTRGKAVLKKREKSNSKEKDKFGSKQGKRASQFVKLR